MNGLKKRLLKAILESPSCGYELSKKIPSGGIYMALSDLEQEGLIRSRLSEPLEVRGWRPRRYYWLTGTGLLEIQKEASENETPPARRAPSSPATGRAHS